MTLTMFADYHAPDSRRVEFECPCCGLTWFANAPWHEPGDCVACRRCDMMLAAERGSAQVQLRRAMLITHAPTTPTQVKVAVGALAAVLLLALVAMVCSSC